LTTRHAPNALPALWVEHYDAAAGQALNSAGCDDMEAALDAADSLLAEAKSLNAELAVDSAALEGR